MSDRTPKLAETAPAPVKTDTPVRSDPAPSEDPSRHYQPERLCPDQSKEGGWRSRP